MCMVYEGDKVLVLNRTKKDWPGLTFPGGHVEENEDFITSVIREMKEETGLDIKDPVYVGELIWPNPSNGYDEVALIYRTNKYEGELMPSNEGEVFFLKISELNKYPFSLDFEKVLEITLRDL